MTQSPPPHPPEETACELLARERSRCVKPCDVCEGEGEIADGLDEAACSMPCPRCDGNAWLVDLGRLSALGPPPTEVREDWTSADEEALHARARSLLKVAGEEMLAIEPNPSIWVSQNSALRAIIRLIEPERRATPPMRDREAMREIINRRVCCFVDEYDEAREEMIDKLLSLSPSPCDCLGEWAAITAERVLYVDKGKETILCDRLPSPVTLLLKNPAHADGAYLPSADTGEFRLPLADRKGVSAGPCCLGVREALEQAASDFDDLADIARTRVDDGDDMGSGIWRVSLTDIASEAVDNAARARTALHGDGK